MPDNIIEFRHLDGYNGFLCKNLVSGGKIVSRYVNLGAFGGGKEPEDYETIIRRPFLFFNLDTAIDTTTIEKSDWTRVLPDQYRGH